MDFIATNKNNGSINDQLRDERLKTKDAEYNELKIKRKLLRHLLAD